MLDGGLARRAEGRNVSEARLGELKKSLFVSAAPPFLLGTRLCRSAACLSLFAAHRFLSAQRRFQEAEHRFLLGKRHFLLAEALFQWDAGHFLLGACPGSSAQRLSHFAKRRRSLFARLSRLATPLCQLKMDRFLFAEPRFSLATPRCPSTKRHSRLAVTRSVLAERRFLFSGMRSSKALPRWLQAKPLRLEPKERARFPLDGGGRFLALSWGGTPNPRMVTSPLRFVAVGNPKL